MIKFNPGYDYVIGFSKWKVERLGKGYDTNCQQYDTEVHSRNDCIFKCHQDKMKNYCKTKEFVYSSLFTRKDYFETNNFSWSYCRYNQNIENDMRMLCEDQCPIECHFTYFFTSVEKSKPEFVDWEHFIIASITFRHNSMPDVFIRHIPEMPLMTFICYFGGLLGMWVRCRFHRYFSLFLDQVYSQVYF